MQFTATQQELIRDMVRKEPLQSGEIRKIPDLGETYIALEETPADDYKIVLMLRIDGVGFKIYFRIHELS
jgi:hypothetical protein